jgi:hypothetical protein
MHVIYDQAMDNEEPLNILRQELAHFRSEPYEELAKRIGQIRTKEVNAPSGAAYQIEIQFFWDNKAKGDIRVMGSIDDGGIRTLVPLTDDFIIDPHGNFVDE